MTQHDASCCEMMKSAVLSKNQNGPRMTVSLFERDFTALTRLAERRDVSISWIARQALSEFVEKHYSTDVKLPLRIDRQASAT